MKIYSFLVVLCLLILTGCTQSNTSPTDAKVVNDTNVAWDTDGDGEISVKEEIKARNLADEDSVEEEETYDEDDEKLVEDKDDEEGNQEDTENTDSEQLTADIAAEVVVGEDATE